MQVLSREIVSTHGQFALIREYVAGRHPELGKVHFGYTGWETVIERQVLVPTGFFLLTDKHKRPERTRKSKHIRAAMQTADWQTRTAFLGVRRNLPPGSTGKSVPGLSRDFSPAAALPPVLGEPGGGADISRYIFSFKARCSRLNLGRSSR
jgi:hypothetical protein